MNRDSYQKYSVYSAKSLSQRAIYKTKKSKKAASNSSQSASSPTLRNGSLLRRRTTSATASTRLMNRNVNAINSSTPSINSTKKSSSGKRYSSDPKVSKSGSLPVNTTDTPSNELANPTTGQTSTAASKSQSKEDKAGKSGSQESFGKSSTEDDYDSLHTSEKKLAKSRNSRMRGQPVEETIPEQSQEPLVLKQSDEVSLETDFFDTEIATGNEEPVPEMKALGKSESRRGYRSSSTALFELSKTSSVYPEKELPELESEDEEDEGHAIVMEPEFSEPPPRSDKHTSILDQDDLYMLPPRSDFSDSPRVEISTDQHESEDDIHKRIDELKKGIMESTKSATPLSSPQISRTLLSEKNQVTDTGMDAAWPAPVDSRRPSSVAVPMPKLAESIVEEREVEDREERTKKQPKTGFELMGLEPSPISKVMSQSGKINTQPDTQNLETSLSSPVLDQKQRLIKSRSKAPDPQHESGEDNFRSNRKIADGSNLNQSMMGPKRLINDSALESTSKEITHQDHIKWLSEILDSKSQLQQKDEHRKAPLIPLGHLEMNDIDMSMEESSSGIHVHVHVRRSPEKKMTSKTADDIPAIPSQPIISSQPIKPSQPTIPSQPTCTSQPAIPCQPAITSEPTITSQPIIPSQPTITSQPAIPTQPTKPTVIKFTTSTDEMPRFEERMEEKKMCPEPASGIANKIGDKKLRDRIACLQGSMKMEHRKPHDTSSKSLVKSISSLRRPPNAVEPATQIPIRPLPDWYEEALRRDNVERHSDNMMLITDREDKDFEIRRYTTDAVNEAPKTVTVVIENRNPMDAHRTKNEMSLPEEYDFDSTGHGVAELVEAYRPKETLMEEEQVTSQIQSDDLTPKKKRRKLGKPQLSVLWTILDAEYDEIYLKGRPIADSLDFFRKISGLTSTMTPLDRYVYACMLHHRRRELRREEADSNSLPGLISHYFVEPLNDLVQKTKQYLGGCREKYKDCMTDRPPSQKPWISQFGGVPQCLCDAFSLSSLISRSTPSDTPTQRDSEPEIVNVVNSSEPSDPDTQSAHEDTFAVPDSTIHGGITLTPGANISQQETSNSPEIEAW